MSKLKLLTILLVSILSVGIMVYFVLYKVDVEKTSVNDKNTLTKNNFTTNEVESNFSYEDWSTYENSEFDFSIRIPSSYSAGHKSKNSILGDAENNVPGIFIDSLVFVPLLDDELITRAKDEINFYKELNVGDDDTGPSVSCSSESTKNETASITFIQCLGSGGVAHYAYISSEKVDFFVDGYSGGYDNKNISIHRRSFIEFKTILNSISIK